MEEWLVPARLDAETKVYMDIATATVPSMEDHEWVWKLKQRNTTSPLTQSVWSGMVESGLSWDTALAHLATLDRPIMIHTSSSCCLCVGRDYADSLPTELTYKVDIIIGSSDFSNAAKKVTVSAASAMDASTTVTGLLQWLSVSSSAVLSSTDEAAATATTPQLDVTIKAFAAQPRLVLAPWNSDQSAAVELSLVEQSSNISTLRMHFLSLDSDTAFSYVENIRPRHLHLVQCSTTTTTVYQALLSSLQLVSLTVSCTLLELALLAPSLGKDCVVPDIAISVHCMLDTSIGSSPFAAFCGALYENITLQRLSLQYLDLTDQAWYDLLSVLHGYETLSELIFGFTDAFVDNVRRLTPERRTERSRAVLQLVESCPALHTVTWPACQHDATVTVEIAEICRQRSCGGDSNDSPAA
jgi:hypothetical protein